MKSLNCPNRRCSRSRKSAAGSIIRHGFYKTTWGKHRRYQCRICGKTFCSNTVAEQVTSMWATESTATAQRQMIPDEEKDKQPLLANPPGRLQACRSQ